MAEQKTVHRYYPYSDGGEDSGEAALALLHTALQMVDGDVQSLINLLGEKMAANATLPISQVDNLQTALNGKSASDHSHALNDLSDVNVSEVGDKYLLGYRAASGWGPISVNAAFGDLSINVNNVSGLSTAMAGKAAASHTHDGRYTRVDQAQTVTFDWLWSDGKKIKVGNDGDLQLLHTGSNSYITNYEGDLYIRQEARAKNVHFQTRDIHGTVYYPLSLEGGYYAILRYGASEKLSTQAWGVKVTGELKVNVGGTDRTVWHKGNVHSDIDLAAGTFGGKRPAQLGSNDPDFESSDQTITAGGLITVAHGLSVRPSIAKIHVALKCTTSEGGFSTGDEIPAQVSGGDGGAGAGSKGCVTLADATNIYVRVGASGFNALGKNTGVLYEINTANWKIVVRAWK